MADLIRQNYSEYLTQTQDTDTLVSLAKKDEYEPIMTQRTTQPEDEPNFDDVNKNIAEIYLDLNDINEKIATSGADYANYRSTVNARLDSIQERITEENERLQDTNMICGNVSDFTAVKRLNSSAFSGDFSYSDDGNTLFCPADGLESTTYTVLDISGNGIAGNKYVKPVTSANTEWIDTSDKSYLSDGNMTTYFEYSRYETSEEAEKQDGIIHYDTEPCRCTIELYSGTQATLLRINSEDTDIILEDLQVSNDGIYYTPAIKKELPIFNKQYSYNNYQYIYGSGILSFKPSHYVRITMRSNAKTSDTIYDPDAENTPVFTNTKRKVVKLNQISLYNASFSACNITSKNAIQQGSLTAISVFANTYIPNNFKKGSYITMELDVNGTSYPIVPVNSDDTGIKIIRYSKNRQTVAGGYIQYIKEPITSAVLHITMQPYNTAQTPFISNMKFCVGKTEDMNVY